MITTSAVPTVTTAAIATISVAAVKPRAEGTLFCLTRVKFPFKAKKVKFPFKN